MNVSLTRQLEQLIDQKVRSGRYGSASEVVREALRLLEQQEQLHRARVEELRSAVAVGVRDLDRGRRRAFDAATVDRIKTEGRKRLRRVKRRP